MKVDDYTIRVDQDVADELERIGDRCGLNPGQVASLFLVLFVEGLPEGLINDDAEPAE